MAPQLISFSGLTLFSVVEALLFTRLIPEKLPDRNPFLWTFLRLFLLQQSLYIFYLGFIYPYFTSPLRHFPRVRKFNSIFAYGTQLARRPPGSQFLEWIVDSPNDGVLLMRSPLHRNRILITNPKALADVLVASPYDFQKPKRIRAFLRRVLGDGLIIVESDQHRFQRKNLMPAFSFRHVKDLYPMMWRKAESLPVRLTQDIKEGQDIFEINGWASKVTLDIIGVAGIGREFNSLYNHDDQIVKDYQELLEPNAQKLLYFFLHAFTSRAFVEMLPWKLNQVFEKTTSSLKSIYTDIVKSKREAVKTGMDDHFDILSLLIKSNNFSDEELVDQLLTFLVAGHETTSSAFTWVTYLLAMNPKMQSILREEIQEAIPSDPLADPSFDLGQVLERLPYLNGVCNETLRLYPTVPITMRVAVRDTKIIDQYVPRGTEIIISPWAINRNPQLWGADAAEFKPERWIDDGKPNNSGGSTSNYSQMTFLHGPRSCIGQGFAKAELRCLVAAFIRAFEWELADDPATIIPGGVITIKPRYGMRVRLKPLSN